MKQRIDFTIRLRADAELGTGLGGEIVNDFIPRDQHRRPIVPASHIKGLMRASLRSIAEWRVSDWSQNFGQDGLNQWPEPLLNAVFGREGQDDWQEQATVYATDARFNEAESPAMTSISESGSEMDGDDEETDIPFQWSTKVTRTRIGDSGVAAAQSLRTTEAVIKGSVFQGSVKHPYAEDSVQELALRLALLSIDALGGSRNRGGQCTVTLDKNLNDSPGNLLLKLDEAIRTGNWHKRIQATTSTLTGLSTLDSQRTIVELIFIADASVCCPERPDKTNVIVSGFSIPATTVQGIIMNHVNHRNPELANNLFAAEVFRCWPLNPCIHPQDRDYQRVAAELESRPKLLFELLPRSIRVSLSHKIAKYSLSETYLPEHFRDEAIGLDWPDVPDQAPLKGVDGVLLYGGKLTSTPGTQLWRAQDMPRNLTTHGVQDGPASRREPDLEGRTLYSVDAMAPLIWRGFITVPANLAEPLVQSLNADPEISIGKRKSVRGAGRLVANVGNNMERLLPLAAELDRTVIVLQSPVLIPPEAVKEHCDSILHQLAQDWQKFHGLPDLVGQIDGEPRACWSSVGIRYGWNRYGEKLPQGKCFQEAQHVLLPGSTFAIKKGADPEKLRHAALQGLFPNPGAPDSGRTRGFGALAIHPGVATQLYRGKRTIQAFPRSTIFGAMKLVEEIQAMTEGRPLPSSSQLRGLRDKILAIEGGIEKARQYLVDQCTRNARIRSRWEPVLNKIDELFSRFPESASEALDALADLATAREAQDASKSNRR